MTVLRLGVAYGLLGLAKRLVPVRTLARLAWIDPRRPDPRRAEAAVAAITRLRRMTGWAGGDCLEAALVLYRELSRAGEQPVLVVGLTREGRHTHGHAWVEVRGAPVLEAADGLTRFTRVVAFAERGGPIPIP
jgi:hypothetical protein